MSNWALCVADSWTHLVLVIVFGGTELTVAEFSTFKARKDRQKEAPSQHCPFSRKHRLTSVLKQSSSLAQLLAQYRRMSHQRKRGKKNQILVIDEA